MIHPTRALLGFLVFCSSLQAACITDSVPADIYASAGPQKAPDTSGSMSPSTADPDDADGEEAPPTEEMEEMDGMEEDEPSGDAPPNSKCDLSGRWLITERLIATGLGVKQASVAWRYYEIEQSGDKLAVAKGLLCGGQIQPVDAVSAAVDYHAAWPKILSQNPQGGRKGSAEATSSGCSVAFDRATVVFGATTPHYLDMSRALPTEQASGSTPGWEDWDNDGKPGISLHVSGLASGTRYAATRTWATWKGDISSGADRFKLATIWGTDESVLGVTTDILKASGVPDSDPKLHFAEFARLSEGQVSGDDAAICAKVRQLAPMLTPNANK